MHKNTPKIVDRKASDNVYLHKDFHVALCYALNYVEQTYGSDAVEAYLRRVAATCYKPLSKALSTDGLTAIEKHFRHVFMQEQGEFSLNYEGETLVLKVSRCPAIAHLKKTGQCGIASFCKTTVTVNHTLCAEAGYGCSCEYEPGRGQCVQKFWIQERDV